MSEGAARLALGTLAAGLVAIALSARLPQFWGDGATYHAMAWSLAEDGDLRYEARDIFRVRREFPAGPQGIFLKRASGGLTLDPGGGFPWIRRVDERDPRIYYAKAYAYPLAAAPFVRLLGTKGLLLTNALVLSLALALGYVELRRRTSPGRALAATLALFLGTVTPVYLLWPTPELFGLAVVLAGLTAWRRDRPLAAAVLLGIATYAKPYNLFLALPLGMQPLLAVGSSLRARLLESSRRGVAMAATVAVLFGLNIAATGEWNYQGGERKTFYDRFPFESREVTFGNSGQWMTTEHLGPLVEGEDEERRTRRTGPLRSAGEIRDSFLRNLGYFWVGRFGGAIPYFFPAIACVLLFAFTGPRDAGGWLALTSLFVSYLFYLWMIPDNWYGGSGTLGNRYFLNLLPLAFFLVPRGREMLVAGAGAFALLVFMRPLFLDPVSHSLRPGDHTMLVPFRLLPAELTMLNDLSVFTDPWRKKQPVGDTEGDAHKHWPADPRAYYLYFLDDGTYGRERRGEAEGFWLRGGRAAEVVVRALEPVRRMRVRVTGGPAGDEVAVRLGSRTQTLTLGPSETRETAFETARGFAYYDTFLHTLRLRSARGGEGPSSSAAGNRPLGAFVEVSLEVGARPRSSGSSSVKEKDRTDPSEDRDSISVRLSKPEHELTGRWKRSGAAVLLKTGAAPKSDQCLLPDAETVLSAL